MPCQYQNEESTTLEFMAPVFIVPFEEIASGSRERECSPGYHKFKQFLIRGDAAYYKGLETGEE